MKILVAGDFCPRNRVERLIDGAQFEYLLGETRSVISNSDYSFVNLECPVINDDCVKPIEKVGPNLKCSSKGLDAIQWVGFNCVTLANNHILDFGEDGINNTIELCKKAKISVVGAGHNLEGASNILYENINGNILAVINCCEHEFSVATESESGSNPLNPIQQYNAIQDARKTADVVIVIVHGGHEHFQLPSPRMVETYRFFIEAGADAVVNHHQHCYSGYEYYKGKPIVYGLGNFLFDISPVRINSIWNYGYMVSIDFSSENPQLTIHPYKQCAEEPKIELLPSDAFNEKLKELNEIISNPEELNRAIGVYYDSCLESYSNIFEPFYNRIYIGAKHRGWLPSFISKKRRLAASNFINCESHRDKLLWWLNKKI